MQYTRTHFIPEFFHGPIWVQDQCVKQTWRVRRGLPPPRRPGCSSSAAARPATSSRSGPHCCSWAPRPSPPSCGPPSATRTPGPSRWPRTPAAPGGQCAGPARERILSPQGNSCTFHYRALWSLAFGVRFALPQCRQKRKLRQNRNRASFYVH